MADGQANREIRHRGSESFDPVVHVEAMKRRDRVKVLAQTHGRDSDHRTVLDLTARDALRLASELLDAVDSLPLWRR